MEELICREGTVHSVIFQNAENGYTVLRLLTEEGEVVTVVGCIPCVAPGEHLTVTGTWEVHPQHGEQLKAQELERTLPEEEEDIFAYLSSGVCKGVGPTTARRIVDRFGLETLDILEAEPERLQEIRGITAKKAMEIGELFRQHMGLRRLMEFLSRYQLPPVLAIRLRQQYGDGALEVVRRNPYLLSDDVCGVDFSVTDTMALSMGFAEDCTERLEAALTFELTYNENNGHVFLPKDKLLAATCQLLSCGIEQVEAALDALAEHHAVVIQRIANVEAVYLRRLWEAETSACARLLALLEMDADETVTWVIDPEDYKADVLFVFENGRVARVALSGYATKTNRKRLKNAIYGGSKLMYATVLKEERDLALVSSDFRLVNFNTSLLKTKTTNSTQGVQALTIKGSRTVTMVGTAEEFIGGKAQVEKFRAEKLPSAGAPMKETDMKSLFDLEE